MATILSGKSRPAPAPARVAVQRPYFRQVIVGATVVVTALVAAPAIATAISTHPHHGGIANAHARCWMQAHRAGSDPGLCTDSPARVPITRP